MPPSAPTRPAADVPAAPPANNSLPTISGTTQAGQTLTADPGVWSGTQPISFSIAWGRCYATVGPDPTRRRCTGRSASQQLPPDDQRDDTGGTDADGGSGRLVGDAADLVQHRLGTLLCHRRPRPDPPPMYRPLRQPTTPSRRSAGRHRRDRR